MNLIKEFGINYFHNRNRFYSIISDKRFNYLESVLDQLEKKNEEITDEEIISQYTLFSDKMQSNSFAIAQLELVVAASICGFRPHLADRLLERAFMSIIYSFGDEISVETIPRFIDEYLLAPDCEPYGGLPPREGILWLKNLKSEEKLIERVLDRMIEENKRELGEL